jgi:ADP-ribosylglycohydrolase
MEGGGAFGWRPGETTDDTEMAMGIANMYVKTAGIYSENELIKEWFAWIDRGPKDVGSWTRSALSSVRRGTSAMDLWKTTGRQSAGNGGVMRAWVTPLVHSQWKQIERDAVRICELSHPDPRCVASAVALQRAIHLMINGETDKEAILNSAIFTAEKFDVGTAAELRKVRSLLTVNNSGYTVDTLVSAFFAFLRSSSYAECLREVVKRGNDADSVGAVAGALAGAYYGYLSIPRHLAGSLRGAGSWYSWTELTYIRMALKLIDFRQR